MTVKSLNYYKAKYIRNQPSAFCSGCGNGTILNCFVRALEELNVPPENVLCVSGIGCSAWIPSPNFNGDTLHTTHGRALAFATGAKVYNNDLKTLVFTGDGDGAGIGGNHLIHAARRNIEITTILVNNLSYAMTGGQIAPTTSHGHRTVTSPYGNPENPFDIVKLVSAAGATYVARWTTHHVLELTKSVKEAISHPGFAFIEVLSQCPTQQRRMFRMRDPTHKLPRRLLNMFSESTYIKDKPLKGNYRYLIPKETPEKTLDELCESIGDLIKVKIVDHIGFGKVVRVDAFNQNFDWQKLRAINSIARVIDQHEGKIELGVFVKEIRPEFTSSLKRLMESHKGEKND